VASEENGISDGRAAIEAAIPHRDPFLFVDRVLAREADRIVTEWDVTADLFALRGHYPGQPIVPGVLVCEFVFQSAAILLSMSSASRTTSMEPDAVPVLTRIEDARFKKFVKPGETLRAQVDVVERLGSASWMKAVVSSSGARVLQIRFTVALVDEPARRGT
jgi:3-hydroxyacyl-[acyl-carrier-protein] dehydratase